MALDAGFDLDGDGSSDEGGILFFDDALGLLTVARAGDSFLGSTLVDVDFSNGSTFNGDERSGLNNLGQVGYSFELANGRKGIAIWTPVPEPAALALVGLSGMGLLCRNRRGRGTPASSDR